MNVQEVNATGHSVRAFVILSAILVGVALLVLLSIKLNLQVRPRQQSLASYMQSEEKPRDGQ